MSCSNCNQNNCSQTKCNCSGPTRYNGPNVDCVGLETNTPYDAVVQQLAEFMCDIIDPIQVIVEGDSETTEVTSVTNVSNSTITYTVAAQDTGWVDLEGFDYYQGAMSTQKPQCRKIGKQVHFRGDLYIPITDGSAIIPITTSDTYRALRRMVPFIGNGGVFADTEDRLLFNSNGTSAQPVVPISVLPALTQIDNTYLSSKTTALRQVQIFDISDPDIQQEGTALLSAYVHVEILPNKTLRLTALNTLESNALDETTINGTSNLRMITSSYRDRGNILDFSDYTYARTSQNTADYGEQSSGSISAGVFVIIRSYQAGDDFSNIGGPGVGLPGQWDGYTFISTGGFPTTWTNGSTIVANSTNDTYRLLNQDIGSSLWPVFLDSVSGPYNPGVLQAANPFNLGGFKISLDGLIAYID